MNYYDIMESVNKNHRLQHRLAKINIIAKNFQRHTARTAARDVLRARAAIQKIIQISGE